MEASTIPPVCSRYEIDEKLSIAVDGREIRLKVKKGGKPRIIQPTDDSPVLASTTGKWIPMDSTWGFTFISASVDPLNPAKKKLTKEIFPNAPCELLRVKPLFSEALKERRCLVPATAWIEFENIAGENAKRPWRFFLDSGPFAMAGLWVGRPGDKVRHTILTRRASSNTADIHERMPVVLPEYMWGDWLRGEIATPSDVAILKGWQRRTDRVDDDPPASV